MWCRVLQYAVCLVSNIHLCFHVSILVSSRRIIDKSPSIASKGSTLIKQYPTRS